MPHSAQVTSETRNAGNMTPNMQSTPQSTSKSDVLINFMPMNGAINPPSP